MADNKINVGGRLHSIATGNVLASADEIFDDNKGKKQSEVNMDVDKALADRYTKDETYNKNELNSLITTPDVQYVTVTATEQTTAVTDVLPATGEANTVYRVGNWDGSQFDASVYSEYAWNGSQYIHLSTKTQIGEVFDISAYHATGGELAKYADLAAALDSNNGGGVPQSLQKGGMSVKFVQSPDNKYIQARCMAQNFTTDTTQWAIANEGVYIENPEFIKVYTDKYDRILWGIKADGTIYFGAGVPPQVVDYINKKIAELSLDEYEDIVAFLNDLEKGDKTLQDLLNEKVDKEEGKSLIDAEYAEGVHYIENPEFAEVKLDSENKIVWAVKTDGTVHFGAGCPPQIKEYVLGNIVKKVDKIEGKGLIQNEVAETISVEENYEYVNVETDNEGRILEGTTVNNQKVINKNIEINGSLSFDGNDIFPTENKEGKIEVKIDKGGSIVSYRLMNGVLIEPCGIRTKEIELSTEGLEKLKHDIKKDGFDPYVVEKSVYRYCTFGQVPPIVYNGLQQDYSWGGRNTMTAEVLTKYDTLVDGSYVTSEVIGRACDGQDIKLYTFNPTILSAPIELQQSIPTIMFICGQHGYEKSSAYGMYYLMKDIIENNANNELLRYFRRNIRFVIVPVVNPSGWDALTYKNGNGVNLNRNWWNPKWTASVTDPDDKQYQGEEAFDQPETAAIRDYILAHKEQISLFVDHHTHGGGVVDLNRYINWYELISGKDADISEDKYFMDLQRACYASGLNVTSVVENLWGNLLIQNEYDGCSYVTFQQEMSRGWAAAYAITEGILGLTLEAFNGFPLGTWFSDEVKQCCSIIEASFIGHYCNCYSKY